MFILSLNTNNANLWRDTKANWGHVLYMSLLLSKLESQSSVLDRSPDLIEFAKDYYYFDR